MLAMVPARPGRTRDKSLLPGGTAFESRLKATNVYARTLLVSV
jgi:hypothetical protein